MNIVDLFTYHPVVTPKRLEQHKQINKMSLDFALYVDEIATDSPTCQLVKQQLYMTIQQARMIANQLATIAEIETLEPQPPTDTVNKNYQL